MGTSLKVWRKPCHHLKDNTIWGKGLRRLIVKSVSEISAFCIKEDKRWRLEKTFKRREISSLIWNAHRFERAEYLVRSFLCKNILNALCYRRVKLAICRIFFRFATFQKLIALLLFFVHIFRALTWRKFFKS